jgi:putative ABC transport system substrate-binding protein
VKRRDLIILLGGVGLLRPLGARAQQKRVPVIGYLNPLSPGPTAQMMPAFLGGLGETGYFEGRNVAIEYRWGEGNFDRLPALAADLVARKVDVIVAAAGGEAALAAKRATSTIPIVFTSVGDPVERGLVASLARPGGNLTGFTVLATDLTPKRLELLSDLVPEARVIALLAYSVALDAEAVIRGAQEAARAKGVRLAVFKVGSESEIDSAFASLMQLRAGGVVVAASAWFTSRRDQLLALAAHHAVPAIYSLRGFTDSGGLISYGPIFEKLYRQAGAYVGRILKGAKPADLPVQQPAILQLVINLKTAKALGLTVPQLLLARADEVIE